MRKPAAVLVVFLLLSIFLGLQKVEALTSIDENSTATTITLSQNVNFTAKVSPSSNIQWFCDGVLAKMEFTSYSTYTYTPQRLGTHTVELRVDEGTNPIVPTEVSVVSTLPTTKPTSTETSTNMGSLGDHSVTSKLHLFIVEVQATISG